MNIINFLIKSSLNKPLDAFDCMDLATEGLSSSEMQALASNNSLELRNCIIEHSALPRAFNAADIVIQPKIKEFWVAYAIFSSEICE